MNFGGAYLLTIPRYDDRCEATMNHLRERGISGKCLYGVDGLAAKFDPLPFDASGYKMDPRAVGIYISHLTVWKYFEDQPFDACLIMEDDVRFDIGWQRRYLDPPKDWDIYFLGSCCAVRPPDGYPLPQHIQGDLYRVWFAMCLHAYAIHRKALPVLLDLHKGMQTHLDIALCERALPNLKAYALLPGVAHQYNTILTP